MYRRHWAVRGFAKNGIDEIRRQRLLSTSGSSSTLLLSIAQIHFCCKPEPTPPKTVPLENHTNELRTNRVRLSELVVFEPSTQPSEITEEFNRITGSSFAAVVTLDEQIDALSRQIYRISNQLRRTASKRFTTKWRNIFEDIQVSESEHDAALMHKVARRVKPNVGPRKTIFGRFAGRRLSVEEWKSFLAQPPRFV